MNEPTVVLHLDLHAVMHLVEKEPIALTGASTVYVVGEKGHVWVLTLPPFTDLGRVRLTFTLEHP